MTFKYKNVYLEETSTVVGPYEYKGPLGDKFDRAYDDLYMNEKSFEQAETKLLEESIHILLNKTNKEKEDIDLIISGDLQNQITASCYGIKKYNIPFLGIYRACAPSIERMIIAASFLETKKVKNAIVSTSSHNMASEKQFRNPTEYGAPKPMTSTFTATGGASVLLTNKKTNIKVEASTIGKVISKKQKDPLNMGAVMAPAAADTIYNHLKDLNRSIDDYDLILTGDLGMVGKEILKDYMMKAYKIDISKNYNDTGTMLYDLKKQKEIHSGGSGPVCCPLVCYSRIIPMLEKKKLKRVLIAVTGALFSPTFVFQHQDIYSISHVISLEAV